MTSGSTKYTFGGAFGPKSRGGVVMTLGGSAGFAACASTTRGAMNATPAAVATVFIAVRREIALLGTIGSSEREALHERRAHLYHRPLTPGHERACVLCSLRHRKGDQHGDQ